MVSPLLALFLTTLIQMTLSFRFLKKSEKRRSSGRTKAFRSYNQTFTSFPAWELAVVSVGTGTGNCVSLQPKRPNIKFQGNMTHKIALQSMSKQKKLAVLQLDLYFFSCLGTSGCPNRDWDRGLMNPCFSLQLRRPNEKFQVNMTKENRFISYVQVLQSSDMVLFYFHFFPNHRLILSGYGWIERGGSFTLTCLKITQTLIVSFILQKNILHNFYFTDHT
jgi:hypothetical protein